MGGLDLTSLRQRLAALFGGFTAGQKAMLGIAVAAVVVGGYLFTQWAAQPSWSPLYTDLAGEDAASITEELAGRGVTYELADGGRTVLVPREQVYQLRIDMSAQGLPAGGSSGYALLDKQGITTSEFRQRVDYQRAMEGELAKTIGSIDGVDAATVHLVIPEEDLFAEDDAHPSASVLVRTRAGRDLSTQQVQAVVHLVASSIEGLVPDEVTVADSKGRVLSAPGQDGTDLAAGDARSQQTKAYEDRLAASVQDMLGQVVGSGGAVVQVRADLDFDTRNTTSELFQPPAEGAPAVNETTTNETYTGPGAGATGILGPDGTPLTGGGETATDYSKEQAERAFAVNKVTEEVQAAPGQVNRLSVAVLLDGNAEGAVDLADVEGLVTAATGLDAARGDTIEVRRMPFDRTAAEAAQEELAAAEAAAQREQLFSLARTLGTVLIIALVLFLAYRSAKKAAAREPVVEALEPAELEALRAGALDQVEQHEALGPGAVPELPRSEEARQREVVAAQVGALIDKQPDEVAQLLRGWLADRRS